MTSRIALRAAFLLVAAAPAHAQLPDSTRQRVDRAFARWNTRESPGCALAVARDGRTVLERGYGMANLEYDVSITPATIFETGSVAKQFTAAAIVLLAQEGKLSLEDDIRKFIPELPEYGQTIRLRHMLNHTSGLRDWLGLAALQGRPAGTYLWTNADVLDIAISQRSLNFTPGAEYLYSNTGYTLLAITVERVSGKPFAEFTRTRIFEPLGMTQTRFRDDLNRVVKGRATAYSAATGGGFRTDMPFMNAHGSGGLLTTVGDLLRWNENFGSGTVGSRALATTLETTGRLTNGRDITYALGLSVDRYRGVRRVSHTGATAGYRTALTRFPDLRLSIAVMCNVGAANTTTLTQQVADAFLGAQAQPGAQRQAAVTLTADQVAPLAGAYFNDNSKALLRVVVRDGKLRIEGSETELTPLAPARFAMGDGELLFTTAPGGVRRVSQLFAGDTAVLTAVTDWSPTPDASRLAEFAGTFRNDEVGATYTVKIMNGALVLEYGAANDLRATPAFTDAFRVPSLGLVRFTRDNAGRVDAFEVYAGRVRSLRFTKT